MVSDHLVLIGIDLARPANHADTAMVILHYNGSDVTGCTTAEGLSDHQIVEQFRTGNKTRTVIGIDAPLSYQDGGGDRARDRQLRTILTEAGLHSGTVMTPTMTRMAYLTLRGVHLASMISRDQPDIDILEVHPAGAMVLHGIEPELVRQMKTQPQARAEIMRRLDESGIDLSEDPSDHLIAAGGAALAVLRFVQERSAWICDAVPPHHPYPFVC